MISREKVIEGLEKLQKDLGYGLPDRSNVVMGYLDSLTDAIALLKEHEAVDKNTGEWKNGHCSCCGEDVSSMLDTWTNVQNFLFCPNCGAKMEEQVKWDD